MLVVYPNTDSVYPITGALGSHSTSFMIMAILQITAWSTTIDYRRDVAYKHSLPPVQGFTCHGVMFLVPIPGYFFKQLEGSGKLVWDRWSLVLNHWGCPPQTWNNAELWPRSEAFILVWCTSAFFVSHVWGWFTLLYIYSYIY
jgi:hypothetical protein